jgi:hypothetical protein
MNGAIPSLPQYAFMASSSVKSTGTTLHFTFNLLSTLKTEKRKEKYG